MNKLIKKEKRDKYLKLYNHKRYMRREIELHYTPLSWQEHKESADNLDSVLEYGLKLCQAREAVRYNFPRVDCNVQVGSTEPNEPYPCFYVKLNEEVQEGNLELALDRYFSIAGTPHFVTGKNMDVANPVLKKHGKKFSSLEALFVAGSKVVGA